jgi:hypothetical protein
MAQFIRTSLVAVLIIGSTLGAFGQPPGTQNVPTITIQPIVPFFTGHTYPFHPDWMDASLEPGLWNWSYSPAGLTNAVKAPNIAQSLFAQAGTLEEPGTSYQLPVHTRWAIADRLAPPGGPRFSSFQKPKDAILNTEGGDLIITNLTPGKNLYFGTTKTGNGATDSIRLTIDQLGHVGIGTGISTVLGTVPASLYVKSPYTASSGSGYPAFMLVDYANVPFFSVRNIYGTTWIGAQSNISSSFSEGLLNVNGKITAKEVLVTNQNWPDYVFDDSYRLMPLDEVARFIAKNRHLPGVPSAREVHTAGIQIGENQAVLLRKIEELTLHLIEQSHRIAELEKLLNAERKGETTTVQSR